MKTKNIENTFLAFGLVLLVFVIGSIVGGCFPADPATTRIVDAQGNVVYNPAGPPDRTVVVPPTGKQELDYILAAIAAGVYGAMGYWIRRVKVNGTATSADLAKRLEALEKGPPTFAPGSTPGVE